MKIETIPCKDCLLVPACKQRVAVKCSLLFKWFHVVDDEDVRSKLGDEISKILPRCFTLGC